MATRTAFALLALASAAFASPTLQTRQSITTVSASKISSFKPFASYASTAYCQPSATLAWNCGANCNANPSFTTIASGGDGDGTQFWYVGYDSSLKTVVVAHQGTDTSEFLALLTDAEIAQSTLDSSLFPGISSSVEAHDGFADEQAKTATAVLSAVKTAISRFGAKKVTLTGHSLGAALALLDAVYLPLHISGVTFQTVVFGLPRVGNQAFADYVDAHVTSFTRINNMEDPVPIVPGRFLGFHHPSGEVHITDSNVWEACPGQDNTSDLCIVGAVPNVFDGDVSNHDGPYGGVTMGC